MAIDHPRTISDFCGEEYVFYIQTVGVNSYVWMFTNLRPTPWQVFSVGWTLTAIDAYPQECGALVLAYLTAAGATQYKRSERDGDSGTWSDYTPPS